jgi:ribosomal protein S18 acetylase RimI-like enzyme
MDNQIEILPLLTLNLAEILPIVTGYESTEKYAVEKSETDERTVFNIHLVSLEQPHRSSFAEDFNDEDTRRYLSFLPQGYSFGAYHQDRLVAFAIGESIPWNRSLRIWEFQVMQGFRRQGIGRTLMDHVVNKAIQDKFRIVWLETQNTNVKAIRFYRALGFSLDALDLSFYTNHDVENGEVAFFMKRKLELLI